MTHFKNTQIVKYKLNSNIDNIRLFDELKYLNTYKIFNSSKNRYYINTYQDSLMVKNLINSQKYLESIVNLECLKSVFLEQGPTHAVLLKNNIFSEDIDWTYDYLHEIYNKLIYELYLYDHVSKQDTFKYYYNNVFYDNHFGYLRNYKIEQLFNNLYGLSNDYTKLLLNVNTKILPNYINHIHENTKRINNKERNISQWTYFLLTTLWSKYILNNKNIRCSKYIHDKMYSLNVFNLLILKSLYFKAPKRDYLNNKHVLKYLNAIDIEKHYSITLKKPQMLRKLKTFILRESIESLVQISKEQHFQNKHLELNELIKEGYISLYHSVDLFESDLGYSFRIFSDFWILQGIQRKRFKESNKHNNSPNIYTHSFKKQSRILLISSDDARFKKLNSLSKDRKIYDYLSNDQISIGSMSSLNYHKFNHQRPYFYQHSRSIAILMYMRYGIYPFRRHTLQEVANIFSINGETIRYIIRVSLQKNQHQKDSF